MVQRGVRRGDGQPARRLAGRHRGAPERQEHLLGHVLGLVPGAEHAGGDRDDPRVGGAEDLFEVASDRASSRGNRYCPITLSRGTFGHYAAFVARHRDGQSDRRCVATEVHVLQSTAGAQDVTPIV